MPGLEKDEMIRSGGRSCLSKFFKESIFKDSIGDINKW